MIHKYTRSRDEIGEQNNMIDHIPVIEKLVKDVLDSKTVGGMYERSDHYVV